MNNIVEGLNEEQLKAVTSTSKHLRIIAGAGTGKTRALTYRIAYLLMAGEVKPWEMVAITFTNKVAEEMKERVRNLVVDNAVPITRLPYIATYHSFCIRFLRSEISYLKDFTKLFTISDDEDQKRYLKETATKMAISEKSSVYQSLIATLDQVKCKGLLPDEVTMDDIDSPYLKLDLFVRFYKTYQNILKKNNTLDFDDILIAAYHIIKNNPDVKEKYHNKFKAFLVDEYQDTNDLQYKLIKEFLSEDASLTVVGDPDQTIYTWRGANSDLIRSVLSNDFPDLETVVLNKNYRSTQKILDVANLLIEHNINREKKDLIAASGLIGEGIDFRNLPSQEMEAKYIATKIFENVISKKADFKDIAVIYRSNYLSRAIENALSLKRIPYRIYGGHRFYDRAVIKDALAYLKILINPNDDASVLRILKAPTRGIGASSLAKVIEYAETNDITYLQAIIESPAEIGLGNKSISELERFKEALGKILYKFSSSETKDSDVIEIIEEYFTDSGFYSHVTKIDKQKEEKEGKQADKEMDNVRELLNNIKSYFNEPTADITFDEESEQIDNDADIPSRLSMFLSSVMLMSQQDEMDTTNAVSLMTVHVSKGLEFKEVFVTGLVNGIFPTSHALNEISISKQESALEEERRMLYVAFTRAKNRLHATWFSGYNFVSHSQCLPSMFLSEAGLLKHFSDYSYAPPRTTSSLPSQKKVETKNKYNNPNDLRKFLDTLPTHEGLNDKIQTTGDIFKTGLETKNKVSYVYKVGMKVISTSYGIGEVREVDKDKITAYFPNKEGDKKTVKFINGALAFKPYSEEE
ncbi:MAG TPA: hypothetical protein DCY93_01410 [Firmicutes bacterium]|nr:hypothetical protein [Bacillota bacterium]